MTTLICGPSAHLDQVRQGFLGRFDSPERPSQTLAPGLRRLGELLPAVLARHGVFCEMPSERALGPPTQRPVPR